MHTTMKATQGLIFMGAVSHSYKSAKVPVKIYCGSDSGKSYWVK